MPRIALGVITVFATLASIAVSHARDARRTWLAGDSHIHSHWSPRYDRTQTPPEPARGGDALYSTPHNARMARQYGLAWMVTTDHGGPNHSKLNLVDAHAELLQSRREVPEVLQFYGMELSMPAMDHHTLVILRSEDEWKVLFNIESQFDANDAWPADPSRNTEAAAFKALSYMNTLPRLPLLFANHPSRSATGIGIYGLDEPRELRNNNDLAPQLYRGMEGAPGHQAATLAHDGSQKRDAEGKPTGSRGAYRNPGAGTLGGFDQMTAIVGGLWDSLLGEGRRFWIVATSDSHVNFADTAKPGSDFWPGQYQKTYVHAQRAYDDILDGLRQGRVFVVAGDLIDELDVTAETSSGAATIGSAVDATPGEPIALTIRFHVPDTPHARGDRPRVRRVDLIAGEVRGPVTDPDIDTNPTARVIGRFAETDWILDRHAYAVKVTVPAARHGMYFRVRGTSSQDLEPAMNVAGENPWDDLWFYSNPVFVRVQGSHMPDER
jgi:hypothetical protein